MSSRHGLRVALLALLCTVFAVPASWGGDYNLGVYYFPGWTAGAPGLAFRDPWRPIQAYPEREPLLGWYSDSDPKVVSQQIRWMSDYGIKFVAFDFYWKDRAPFLDHTLKVFKKVKTKGQIKYALLWANHFRFEGGQEGFEQLVSYWIREHFSDPDYLKMGGKPVIFVFSVEEFVEMAGLFRTDAEGLVRVIQRAAKSAGFPGVALVASSPGLAHWVRGVAPKAGFSALSAYNYHIGYNGDQSSATAPARSFDELRSAYRVNWKWIVENGPLQFIVPIASGWDDRPWGGKRPAHEQAVPSAKSFEAHLREAKALMDAYPEKTQKTAVICCWNEFGEGSYIEPTKKDGFDKLEKIKSVFGTP